LPFYLSFNPQAAGGFDFVVPELRTEIDKFLILFGLFLFLVFSFLVTRLDSGKKIGLFVIWIGVSALLSEAWAIPLLTILLPLFALSLFIFLKDLPEKSAAGFVSLLIATAAFIALLCEVIFLDDPISGEFARMNTVFKFYMHLWIFLAIAASYSYYELSFRCPVKSRNRTLLKEAVKKAWVAVLVLLVISCAFFPVVSTFTRIRDMDARPSLDGMEYMKELDRGDYNAIQWMQENIEGSPVVLEASEDNSSYSYTSRVSANTGLPTVLGWARHERFWGRDHAEVRKRIEDVRSIYSTGSEKKALELMNKYNISYVYIGQLERQIYHVRLDKFENETYFEPVYQGSVTIYKLKKGL
jgi:YYY domain-containing protein